MTQTATRAAAHIVSSDIEGIVPDAFAGVDLTSLASTPVLDALNPVAHSGGPIRVGSLEHFSAPAAVQAAQKQELASAKLTLDAATVDQATIGFYVNEALQAAAWAQMSTDAALGLGSLHAVETWVIEHLAAAGQASADLPTAFGDMAATIFSPTVLLVGTDAVLGLAAQWQALTSIVRVVPTPALSGTGAPASMILTNPDALLLAVSEVAQQRKPEPGLVGNQVSAAIYVAQGYRDPRAIRVIP